MKHAGELVRSVVRERGISVSELARRLSRSRQFIYNLYQRKSIDTAILHDLRAILNYPFTELLGQESGYKTYSGDYLSEKAYVDIQDELKTLRTEMQMWKDKYMELLEFTNQLLVARDKGKK
ncbi:MAG: helix-turn-helix domain-containing protein [Bacteroidia bacterium]